MFEYVREFRVSRYLKYSALVFGATLLGGLISAFFSPGTSIRCATTALTGGNVWATTAAQPVQAIGGPSPEAYFFHNTGVLLGLWITGFSVIGPFYLLFQNGYTIGVYMGDALSAASGGSACGVSKLAFLVPHGVLEIPAIILAGAASLYLAHSVFQSSSFGGETKETVDVIYMLRETAWYIMLMLTLLAFAAYIESNVSPGFAEAVSGVMPL